jgi:hypothetical protein
MGALSVSGAWTKHCPRTRRTKHCSGERSGTQTYLAHVAFRQELIDEPLAHAIPHRVELLTHRSRVVVILQEHKGEVMLVHAGHSWGDAGACRPQLGQHLEELLHHAAVCEREHFRVDLVHLLERLFPDPGKVLAAPRHRRLFLFWCFLFFVSYIGYRWFCWPHPMFADVRALQELKNFDSQFVEGVKGVSMCQFVNKDAETKVYDVCPIVPWTCPSGQLPYNSLDERKLIADFQGSPEPSTGGLPGKCKVAPPLRGADGEFQDA